MTTLKRTLRCTRKTPSSFSAPTASSYSGKVEKKDMDVIEVEIDLDALTPTARFIAENCRLPRCDLYKTFDKPRAWLIEPSKRVGLGSLGLEAYQETGHCFDIFCGEKETPEEYFERLAIDLHEIKRVYGDCTARIEKIMVIDHGLKQERKIHTL